MLISHYSHPTCDIRDTHTGYGGSASDPSRGNGPRTSGAGAHSIGSTRVAHGGYGRGSAGDQRGCGRGGGHGRGCGQEGHGYGRFSPYPSQVVIIITAGID